MSKKDKKSSHGSSKISEYFAPHSKLTASASNSKTNGANALSQPSNSASMGRLLTRKTSTVETKSTGQSKESKGTPESGPTKDKDKKQSSAGKQSASQKKDAATTSQIDKNIINKNAVVDAPEVISISESSDKQSKNVANGQAHDNESRYNLSEEYSDESAEVMEEDLDEEDSDGMRDVDDDEHLDNYEYDLDKPLALQEHEEEDHSSKEQVEQQHMNYFTCTRHDYNRHVNDDMENWSAR